jgi:hypothetical protein
MSNFVMGVIVGIVLASVGFSGLAYKLDQGIAIIKKAAQATSED